MDKRYQVFVSSTYRDLQDERQEVMQALLELDCIPAGMELFPAANDDQWTLIKKVIDDCDYYIVIIAGRYGSVGPAGTSFTEMEYRYAVERGKPVIGFLHKAPDTLPANRCESDPAGKASLELFRELVRQKMCRFWESPADLGSQVSRSLVKLIKSNPAVGWVRADQVPDASAAEEILRLKKVAEELEAQLQATRLHPPEGTDALAQGDDEFSFSFSFTVKKPGDYLDRGKEMHSHKVAPTWNRIFAAVSPKLIDELSEPALRGALNNFVAELAYPNLAKRKEFRGLSFDNWRINDADFQTIKVQLRALGLIAKSSKPRSVKDTSTYWTLTPYGDTLMTRLRAIQKTASAT